MVLYAVAVVPVVGRDAFKDLFYIKVDHLRVVRGKGNAFDKEFCFHNEEG